MRLFSTNELGRVTYLLILVAMLGFDFVKSPIEKYFTRFGDMLSTSAFEGWQEGAPAASAPTTQAPLPSFGKLGNSPAFAPGAQVDINGPALEFTGAMMAAYEKARAEGRELTELERRAIAINTLRKLPGNEHAVEKAATLAAGQAVGPFIAIAMTAATVLMLFWMVTGRVRNIGWSQSVAFGIIALYFLPKIAGGSLPPALLDLLDPLFLCLTVVIGIIPPAGGGWFGDRQPVYEVKLPERKARPGEFGRRGVS